MRGTVLLLLDGPGPRARFAEHFRANDLRVHAVARSEDELMCLDVIAPDVIVIDFGPEGRSALVRELRGRVDHATSIIVVSALQHREPAREAGADRFMLEPALPSQVLYEVHRALILRRSGRRLSWN